jgi:hypothetical protein
MDKRPIPLLSVSFTDRVGCHLSRNQTREHAVCGSLISPHEEPTQVLTGMIDAMMLALLCVLSRRIPCQVMARKIATCIRGHVLESASVSALLTIYLQIRIADAR